MTLRIAPVDDKRGMRDFIAVPWRVYADDPNWIPPLKVERASALSSRQPFFEHARWQPFIAFRDSVPVGRISAQVDDLYQHHHDPEGGFFGMFECLDDGEAIDGLLAAVERWLVDQGCKRMVGPFNLNINQEVGVLIDGFDSPPSVMMGHGRPYYRETLLARGLSEVQHLLAYEIESQFQRPPLMRAILEQMAERVTVRTLNRRKLRVELETLRSIFNDAWSENWKFVPWTEAEFLAVGREMVMLVPDDFVQIAEIDGEAVAFIVLLPNINEAIADLNGRLMPFGWLKLLWRLKVRYPSTGRVVLMGVRRRLHHTRFAIGLAMCCIAALQEPAQRKGIERAELSWILEDNKGMRSILDSIGGRVTKTYAMFEKALDGHAT